MPITRLSSVLPLRPFSSASKLRAPRFLINVRATPIIPSSCKKKYIYIYTRATYPFHENTDVIKFLWPIISSIAGRRICIFNERREREDGRLNRSMRSTYRIISENFSAIDELVRWVKGGISRLREITKCYVESNGTLTFIGRNFRFKHRRMRRIRSNIYKRVVNYSRNA